MLPALPPRMRFSEPPEGVGLPQLKYPTTSPTPLDSTAARLIMTAWTWAVEGMPPNPGTLHPVVDPPCPEKLPLPTILKVCVTLWTSFPAVEERVSKARHPWRLV